MNLLSRFKKTGGFALSFLLLSIGGHAQSSAINTSEYGQFQHGVKLYLKNQYSAAQQIFQRLHQETERPDLKEETAYYDALSAAFSKQPDAEARLIAFARDYPESPRRNSAFSRTGDHFFKNGEYTKAGEWYSRVDENDLSGEELENFNFNQGYIAFRAKNSEKAENYFSRVSNSPKYGSQAKYYLGFLAYEGEDYDTANELFDEVDETEKVDKNVSYFQSNMSFQSGDFEKAITQAKAQLQRSNHREQSELNKIIGESYFNLEEYQEAIPYLEKYEGKRGRWSNTDYYQLGYAYYQQKDYEKAISQFNKIIEGKDEVAQNAYYHLAESYIHLDQKQQALNAFKNASEMPYNETIKEDAALNYAKLSYDIGNNYKSVPEVLTDFLKDYPDSPAKPEIQDLLVNSYVTSKNYEKALNLLEDNSSFSNPEVYQKVAFYRGLELYNEGDYKDAKTLFDKSIHNDEDPAIAARAAYWKGESDYNLEDYPEALKAYKAYNAIPEARNTPEFKSIDYNLGYTYFNQQEYDQAARHFKSFLDSGISNPNEKNDTYLRLGDSYFATSDYWKAMEEYNKAIDQKGVDSDYAYFQKAISYGFVDRNQQKIEDLNDFINRYPKSLYYDDAVYELGNTYVTENQSDKALQTYNKIIEDLPNSRHVSRALLRSGLVYYNEDQNEKALSTFKTLAAEFPNTDEARQAVSSARNIYVDMGETDAYAQWVKSLDFVDVSDSDIDNATYESAENQIIDGNDEKAITAFKKYLKQFPKGLQAAEAHFNLARLYYRKEDLQRAEPHYRYVVDQPKNEFTEKSLERLSRIYLSKGDNKKAIPVLEDLEQTAKMRENITFAQSNLMKAYYEQKDYEKTVAYAEKVLEDSKAENRAKLDAQLFTARSAMKTGDEDRAEKAYAEVAENAQGKQAAEAQYYNAYFKRKANDYKGSNEAVQVLAKDFSGYKEYSVKGLLLMGKNFYDLDDAYQASYILQNIIDNFKDFPDAVAEAKSELKRIKEEEAQTNSSIDDNQ